MSAFGGKADISRTHGNICFWHKADMAVAVGKFGTCAALPAGLLLEPSERLLKSAETVIQTCPNLAVTRDFE